MILRMLPRSTVSQLCLLIFALVVAVLWYKDYLDSSSRLWYDREHSKALLDQERVHPQDEYEHIEAAKPEHPKHMVRPDGLLETNLKGRHPIWDLIEEGERQWKLMTERQSTTLAEAVTEYTRRNGYPPPADFDLWFNFAQKHNVKLIDEFDQINYDITPYLALSPSKFRERVEELADPSKAYHFNITDGQLDFYGPQWAGSDQRQFASMMMGFSRALPDMVVHGHAQPRGDLWVGEDLRRAAKAKASAGQYFTEEELQHFESLGRNPHTDRKNACMPDDPVFNSTLSWGDTPTFIASHLTSMSPCSNPSVHNTPPILFAQGAKTPRLTPHFTFSKHRPDSGLLLPTNFRDFQPPLLIKPHAWEERRGKEQLFWQGPNTGWNWFKGMASRASGITWRDGVRAKFAMTFGANATRGPEKVELLVEDVRGDGLVLKTFDRTLLNEKWMDVSLTGEPIQCNKEDGTCEDMRQTPIWKETYTTYKKNQRKFVVDLDSNAWSEEFQRKLSWGNVVLKATTYPEWNTQWLIPYYHYIPIQTDYSDVYNIMAFFLGDPETSNGGHEDVAEKLSRQASTFARENWRWVDMQAYLFRLMLEYARLGSEDRTAASFRM